ncbi:MAG: C2 family cysteine protease [Candidatus Thiodiazotropha taylori]
MIKSTLFTRITNHISIQNKGITNSHLALSAGKKLFIQTKQCQSNRETTIKKEFKKLPQNEKNILANDFITEAGQDGIELLSDTPDGQHALAEIYQYASDNQAAVIRSVHIKQGNTAVNYSERYDSSTTSRISDPDPHKNIFGPPTTRTDDQLFIDGISIDDVNQGSLGDCYLIATIASIAKTNPEFISNMIADNQDGTYTVRLYDAGHPRYIIVDADLYRNDNGDPAYTHGTNPREIWPAIIEKAYAKINGGYDDIVSGYPRAALLALTGNVPHWSSTSSISLDNMYSQMERALTTGRPVIASSLSSGDSNYEQNGLAFRHAYSVTGVYTDTNGQRWVNLRNPWGYSTDQRVEYRSSSYNSNIYKPGDSIPDYYDGNFRMKIEDFQQLFRKIAYDSGINVNNWLPDS